MVDIDHLLRAVRFREKEEKRLKVELHPSP